jgi:hypothetical protein
MPCFVPNEILLQRLWLLTEKANWDPLGGLTLSALVPFSLPWGYFLSIPHILRFNYSNLRYLVFPALLKRMWYFLDFLKDFFWLQLRNFVNLKFLSLQQQQKLYLEIVGDL